MVDTIFVIMIIFHDLIAKDALTEKPGDGNCGEQENDIKCCTDYMKNGTRCVRCIGSFGPQCNKLCHPGFYGFGCKNKCGCEPCDRISGSCIANNAVNDTHVQSDIMMSLGSWFLVIFSVVISIGSIAGVLAKFYIRRRSDVKFTTEPQTFEDVNEDELSYDDVRESQMVMDEIVRLPRSSNDASSNTASVYMSLECISNCHMNENKNCPFGTNTTPRGTQYILGAKQSSSD